MIQRSRIKEEGEIIDDLPPVSCMILNPPSPDFCFISLGVELYAATSIFKIV